MRRNYRAVCFARQSMTIFISYATLVCCSSGGVHANLPSCRWIGHDRGLPAKYRPEREICCCQRTPRSRNVWAQPDVLTEAHGCADDRVVQPDIFIVFDVTQTVIRIGRITHATCHHASRYMCPPSTPWLSKPLHTPGNYRW